MLLRKIVGIPKGSGEPNILKVGTVTRAQLEEIATVKEPDITAADMDAAVRRFDLRVNRMSLVVWGARVILEILGRFRGGAF